jgi:DnaJ-domain-containing protein 1
MLSTGGNRRRKQRGSCYVNKPAYGFFIAGSTYKKMNGVYIRDNPPTFTKDESDPTKRESALYYSHEDDESGWAMSLDMLAEEEKESSSSEDEYGYGYRYRPPKKKKEYEWVFIDPEKKSRFSHDGDTIVPGAGVRWAHIHHATTGNTTFTSEKKENDKEEVETNTGNTTFTSEKKENDKEEVETNTDTTSIVKAKEDDEDELPWQVIALLDQDIMQQLVWQARRRRQRVKRSMAGASAPKAGQFTLEGCFTPGRFLYRVVAKEGLQSYTSASITSTAHHESKLSFLSYAIGVEIDKSGQWLRLDEKKHPPSTYSRSYYGDPRGGNRYYDASYGLGGDEVWVQIYTNAGTPLLVQVDPEDMPHLEEVDEEKDDGGLEKDKFDQPFVPRVEDTSNNNDDNEPEIDIDSDFDDDFTTTTTTTTAGGVEDDEEDSIIDSVREEAATASSKSSYPIGTPVVLDGLIGAAQQKYNGVSGVVITCLDTQVNRHSIRLNAPFSGKRLMVHPLNLVVSGGGNNNNLNVNSDDDEDDMDCVDDIEDSSKDSDGDKVVRYCRTLGIDPVVLGLVEMNLKKDVEENVGDKEEETTNPFRYGFGLAGSNPIERLRSALRAATRDTSGDQNAMLAVEEAGTYLIETIQATKDTSASTASMGSSSASALSNSNMPPHLLLISGVLGPRAAAAASAAHSLHDLNTSDRGVSALRKLLRNEEDRRSSLFSLTPDDGGVDEMRLRLTIVSALLHGSRDQAALREATTAIRASNDISTSACFIRARCLFRCAQRADALVELKRAVAAGDGGGPSTPDGRWAHGEAVRMLKAVKQAETRRVRAVDAYERGRFEEAVTEYTMAIDIAESGFREDKMYRATLLSNRAAVHRRRGKEGLDEALVDCDRALCLLPKMARCLFRRGCVLLEMGKPEEAVAALETLYRVDRAWPKLSEHLLRAHASLRRKNKADKMGNNEDSSDEGEKDGYYTSDSDDGGSTRRRKKKEERKKKRQAASPSASGPSSTEEADRIAREQDHYVVLGVNADATEKQLKTAYRMMSLKYHPDRKGGSTAAFQRISVAYKILCDAATRRDYDEGNDLKSRRGGGDSDSDGYESEEENKQTLREEIERKYFPERYEFWPFGDPFINKRKRAAKLKRQKEQQAKQKKAWYN